MISPLNDAALEVGTLLLAAPDTAARASIITSAFVETIPDSACVLHRLASTEEGSTWIVLGVAGEISVEQTGLQDSAGLLAPLLEDSPQMVIYPGSSLRREEYAHLHVSRSIVSLGYVPLLNEAQLIGILEVVTFSAVLTPEQLDELSPIVQLAAPALLAAESGEQQRQELLDSVHRMSQLYDLEKSLNSTLELDDVTAMIPVKAIAMLPCQAVHLWLFDGGALRLVSTSGADDTIEVGVTQAPGEGYVADMAEEGDPLLIDDPDDERLTLRNQGIATDFPITNVLIVPLIQDEAEVGVIEAVNREGHPFDEDDQFFLSSMAETVSSALKNASLMHAERKLAILEALVHVSSEITSTLRLDHLLQIIVNSPQSVLPFERCSIALDNRGRLQLKAVSGMATIPHGDVQVEHLRTLLQWLSGYDRQLLIRQHEEEPETEEAQARAAIGKHFETSGYRALFALPLADDQGRVGLLLYESTDPDFLEVAHIEMIKVLAGQTTVAIRNALLYREVPLINLLAPLVQRKQAFLRSDRKRQGVIVGTVVAVILLLVFCPLPLRVSGTAVVAPQSLATLAAPVEGTIANVYAREGLHVTRGEVLATMDDWSWRSQLTAAQAKYEAAMLAMQGDLAHHSAKAGEDRTQADYLHAEMERTRLRIANAQLRSPIDGIVMTPDLQNAVGEHLNAGATFAQVLNLASARINIAVDQEDAKLVQAGQTAAIKLNSFPAQTLHGQVFSISPEAQPSGDGRVFYAHVLLPNGSAQLRTGMDGRAKIFAGFRPAGFVLLRAPALWLWKQLWDWIGW